MSLWRIKDEMGNPDRPQKTMFLITAYFDGVSAHKLQSLIDNVSSATENNFMQENKIPPHLTLCQVQTRSGGESLAQALDKTLTIDDLFFPVKFISCGDGIPNNVFTKVEMDVKLKSIIEKINQGISSVPDIKVSPFYKPENIFPHVTLGKRLSQAQQKTAMEVLKKQFQVFPGTITEITLSCGKPPVDLWRISLK